MLPSAAGYSYPEVATQMRRQAHLLAARRALRQCQRGVSPGRSTVDLREDSPKWVSGAFIQYSYHAEITD